MQQTAPCTESRRRPAGDSRNIPFWSIFVHPVFRGFEPHIPNGRSHRKIVQHITKVETFQNFHLCFFAGRIKIVSVLAKGFRKGTVYAHLQIFSKRVAEGPIVGVQVFISSGLQVFRSLGLLAFRPLDLQYWSIGLLVFWSYGLLFFRREGL